MGVDQWLFRREDLLKSPSAREGYSREQEDEHRQNSCVFINKCAQRFKPPVPILTIATAAVFYHRFFSRQSLKAHDRRIVAATCLHLAGKVEEAPKRLADLVQVYHLVRNKASKPLDSKGEEFQKCREQMLNMERRLLHTLAFDLSVDHPHKYIPDLCKFIRAKANADQAMMTKAMKVTWQIANDSVRTDLCLLHPSKHLICGFVAIACAYCDLPRPEHAGGWIGTFIEWSKVGLTEQLFSDICREIMEIYQRSEEPRFAEVRSTYRNFLGLRADAGAPAQSAAAPAQPAAAPAQPAVVPAQPGVPAQQAVLDRDDGAHRDKRQRM